MLCVFPNGWINVKIIFAIWNLGITIKVDYPLFLSAEFELLDPGSFPNRLILHEMIINNHTNLNLFVGSNWLFFQRFWYWENKILSLFLSQLKNIFPGLPNAKKNKFNNIHS